MSLMSLPSEILFDIIGYIASDWHHSRLPSPDVIKIASTCQVLRAVCIDFIYSSIGGYSDYAPMLHKFLVSNVRTAACVRKLTLSIPRIGGDTPGKIPWGLHKPTPLLLQQQILRSRKLQQEILRCCTRLQELVLRDPSDPESRNDDTDTPFEDIIFRHIAPESRKSIEKIQFKDLRLKALFEPLRELFSDTGKIRFPTLKEMGIECGKHDHRKHTCSRETSAYLQEAYSELAEGTVGIQSVQSLDIKVPFPYRFEYGEPGVFGSYLARAMPRVKALRMATSAECIYGTLYTYAMLGSYLTELTLGGKYCASSTGFQDGSEEHQLHHFCSIIPKLSPSLTKLVIDPDYTCDLNFCHKLFGSAGNWPHLNILSVECTYGCDGIKTDLLRVIMRDLTQIRPQASLFMRLGMKGHGERDYREADNLVCWNYSPGSKNNRYIAPLEMFNRLDPAYIDLDEN